MSQLNKHTVNSSTLLKTRLEYILECPHCKEDLCVSKEVDKWAANAIEEIGYDAELASEEEGFQVHCEECKNDFTIIGVSHF